MADALLALDAALASPANSAFPRLPPVIVQLTTASELFSACARLAGCLQLGAPTLYRLTSALVLVTGPSRLALVAALKPARSVARLKHRGNWCDLARSVLLLVCYLSPFP